MTYTVRTNLQPTYLAVPSGSTSVLYPALFDPGDPTVPRPAATYLAADADGDGVADTGLYRLPVGEINGVTYYAGVRIVDNAAAVNASVAMSWPDTSTFQLKSAFVPTQIDLNTLLVVPAEGFDLSVGYRTGYAPKAVGAIKPTVKPVDDLALHNVRTDFEYSNTWVNEWLQLGRRLDNPGWAQLSSSGNPTVQYLALPPSEGALMARKFILRDPSVSTHLASPSVLERYLPTSVYCSNPGGDTGQYQSTPFTNAMTWFNSNFNYPVIPTTNTLPIRALLTARSGVTNFVPNKFTWKPAAAATTNMWSATMTYNFGDWVTDANSHAYVCINAPLPGNPGVTTVDPTSLLGNTAWVAEPWSNAPTKASANTASFAELWAAYWSVMWDKSLSNANANAAGVPVGADTMMFRNAVRTTGATASALTPRQMLQLRASLAAINTIGLRASDGQIFTGFGDVKSRNIIINSDGTSPVYNATVFSGAANPYITEVYADAQNQYIAVELYNPFQWNVTLTNWQLATIARTGTSVGAVTPLVTFTAATAPTIPAQGYAVIVSSLAIPGSATGAITGTPTVVPTLTNAFNNELVLLRPRQASGSNILKPSFPLTSCSNAAQSPTTATNGSNYNDLGDSSRDYPLESALNPLTLVPVDSYDFTGLIAPAASPTYAVWHYIRPNDSAAAGKAWHFVYPGQYVPGNASMPVTASSMGTASGPPTVAANAPRQTGTLVQASSVITNFASLGAADGGAGDTVAGPLATPFREFALQIANTDFGGPYKLWSAVDDYPYGGFPRNGDLLQVPYIGAYILTTTPTAQNPIGLVEMNSVTMDAAFADDGDGLQGENVGRFCPINASPISDLTPTPVAPNPTPNDYAPANNTGTNSLWRYHWAAQLFDYLTVESPQEDYFPEVDPQRYVYWNGANYITTGPANGYTNSVIPVANANPKIANNSSANVPANSTEDTIPVNGLININTASWRVLASLPLVLQAGSDMVDQANTAKLAQIIVYFRDVDDGTMAPALHPHGPFTTIYDLNSVPNFRTAMGTIIPGGTTATSLDDAAGDITPLNDTSTNPKRKMLAGTTVPQLDNVVNNYEQQNNEINRISNLITTRSDSFTVYIIVQGFRNAGTASPELVVQRRAAFIADRSGVTPTNSNINSLNVPVN